MEAVEQLQEKHPHKRFILVPKYEGAFEKVPDGVTLGFPNGYSAEKGFDIASADVWRNVDNPIHILGGATNKQYDAIQKLTGPNLCGDPPANVVGADWNGPFKMAYHKSWTPNGWKNSVSTPRETVRESLRNIREYLDAKGLWHGKDLEGLYGPAVREPDDPVYAVSGGDIRSLEDLEGAVVEEYDAGTYAFESDTARKLLEYRGDLV